MVAFFKRERKKKKPCSFIAWIAFSKVLQQSGFNLSYDPK